MTRPPLRRSPALPLRALAAAWLGAGALFACGSVGPEEAPCVGSDCASSEAGVDPSPSTGTDSSVAEGGGGDGSQDGDASTPGDDDATAPDSGSSDAAAALDGSDGAAPTDAGAACGPCVTPPANRCVDGQTVAYSHPVGTCVAGACVYGETVSACSSGCAAGLCSSAGFVKHTSNTGHDLSHVWGSSARAVWAVGRSGTTVLYDGASWQVRPTGTTDTFQCVHGTSASNVFASTTSGKVFKFDGAQWSQFATVPSYDSTCVFAAGVDDVWVGTYVAPEGTRLYHLVGANQTLVATIANERSGAWGMGGSSSSDVWVIGNEALHWDGATATRTALYGSGIYAVSPQLAFVANGRTGDIEKWAGATPAQLINTGYPDLLYGITGTSASRVFAAGGRLSTNQGAIVAFDGVGTRTPTLPSGTKFLRGIWAARSGEVFAVGNGGTILVGP